MKVWIFRTHSLSNKDEYLEETLRNNSIPYFYYYGKYYVNISSLEELLGLCRVFKTHIIINEEENEWLIEIYDKQWRK